MSEIETTIQPRRKKVWIVRLLGLFLLLAQSAGLIAGGAYYLKRKAEKDRAEAAQKQSQNQNDNSQSGGFGDNLKSRVEITKIAIETDVGRYKSIFNPIGILIGLSAIGFFFRLRSGLLFALLIEGAVLYVSLSFYFSNKLIPIIYPIMLYGIFMVLFLNSGAVRKAFLPRVKKIDD